MRSMTGFGRAEATLTKARMEVEVASVNRKQSDIVISLPREWTAWEAELRKLVVPHISRGRVQLTIRLERVSEKAGRLSVDEDLAAEYLEMMQRLSAKFHLPHEASIQKLLGLPGVVTSGEGETVTAASWPIVEASVQQALLAFVQSREREGEHLQQDLEARLRFLSELGVQVAALAPSVVTAHREALHRRLQEAGLPLPLDDERLAREIALFADKVDISEELTRLHGHTEEFRRLMASPEAQGRAMDFLTQEIHRELNTMASKASSTAISHLIVSAKTELERIREQVQNIE